MNSLKLSLVSFLSIQCLVLSAAEVDQFTRRDEPLADSSLILNQKANKAIVRAIKRANNKGEGCNEEGLYDELREDFSNHLKSEMIKEIIKDPSIPKRSISTPESVYQDWSVWDGVGIGFSLISKKGVTMSDVMKVGDHTIGTDKLEHMFGQGFQYFKKNYLKEKGEVKAVKRGAFGEKFLLGGQKIGNGVFSYGDLSANFNGMRLWNHMLQLRDDVLGEDHNIGPYIVCQKNKWVANKEIDFRDYIDPSMDESINCSKFPTQKTVRKFKAQLKSMGMTCPMDQALLDEMGVKYKHMAKWMINPDGTGEVKYFGEFKNK